MELANFWVQKNVNISQEKLGSRVVQVKKVHVHIHVLYSVFSATPNKKIQNHRDSPYKLCLEKACLLCPPPCSSLVMGSFSHGSPIVDIHMVKTRLGTGVPRSPESIAPILSLWKMFLLIRGRRRLHGSNKGQPS